MKTGLTFFLMSLSTLLWSQQAVVEPDNPAPRVGDQVNLNILLTNGPTDSPADPRHRVAAGSLKFAQSLSDTGMVNIGPFSFSVDGQTYESSAITLSVRPALPEHEVRGLWCCIVRYEGSVYVIVEQRIPTSVKRDPGDPNTLVLSSDEPEFADLITERMHTFGLEFVSSSVDMDTEVMDRRGKAASVSYRVATYKFRPSGIGKQKIRIDRTFFTNFPRGITFEEPYLE